MLICGIDFLKNLYGRAHKILLLRMENSKHQAEILLTEQQQYCLQNLQESGKHPLAVCKVTHPEQIPASWS